MFGQAAVGAGNPQQYLVVLAIALVVIVLRNRRPRRLKVERLWIFPLIYLAFLVSGLVALPPPLTPVSIGILAAAALIGALIGWQRGRFMRIDIDTATHELSTRASVIGIAFILAVLIARLGLRDYLARTDLGIGVPPTVLGDAFLILAVAMLSVQRLEIWIRATRMLNEARGASVPPV